MTNENRIAGHFFFIKADIRRRSIIIKSDLIFNFFSSLFKSCTSSNPSSQQRQRKKIKQESEKKRHASPSPTPPPNPSLPPPPGLHPPRRPHLLPHHRHLATQPLPNLHSPDPVRASVESFRRKNHSNFHARGPSSRGFEYLECE